MTDLLAGTQVLFGARKKGVEPYLEDTSAKRVPKDLRSEKQHLCIHRRMSPDALVPGQHTAAEERQAEEDRHTWLMRSFILLRRLTPVSTIRFSR
jgi:hypothetical protein